MFSRKNILIIIVCSIFAVSCKKEIVDIPSTESFSVNADGVGAASDTAYYSLAFGLAKATFNFTGNPVNVMFYSGELGHKYIYRDRLSAAGISKFTFSSQLNGGTQLNSLRVMISTDFKGVVNDFRTSATTGITYTAGQVMVDNTATLANVSAATWTDITPATLVNNTSVVNHTIDLSAYAAAGKKVYIAFKYAGQSGSVQNQWTINNVSLTNTLADGSVYTLANLNDYKTAIVNYGANTYSPGWYAPKFGGTADWNVNTSRLLVPNTKPTAVATANQESWVFLGDIDLYKVTPDFAVGVKNGLTNTSSAPFAYTYTSLGKYDATFVVTNATSFSPDDAKAVKVPVVVK